MRKAKILAQRNCLHDPAWPVIPFQKKIIRRSGSARQLYQAGGARPTAREKSVAVVGAGHAREHMSIAGMARSYTGVSVTITNDLAEWLCKAHPTIIFGRQSPPL
jgi:hypothetical protein